MQGLASFAIPSGKTSSAAVALDGQESLKRTAVLWRLQDVHVSVQSRPRCPMSPALLVIHGHGMSGHPPCPVCSVAAVFPCASSWLVGACRFWYLVGMISHAARNGARSDTTATLQEAQVRVLDTLIARWRERGIIKDEDSGGYALAVQPLPLAETDPGAGRCYDPTDLYDRVPISEMPGTPLVFTTIQGAVEDMAWLIKRWRATAAAAGMASAEASDSMPAAWKDLFAAMDCEFVTDARLGQPLAGTVQMYCFGQARIYHLWGMIHEGGNSATRDRIRTVLTEVGLSACPQCS